MEYEEFCDGVGMTIDRKCYERIEAVYMAFDRFKTKDDIYNFYKQYDMNGIEKLYERLVAWRKLTTERDRLRDEARELDAAAHDIAITCGIS